MKTSQEKKHWFPSVAGIIGGLIPGVAALFNQFSSPFWITLNIVVIVLAFGFVVANVIGLAVVRYRKSSNPGTHDR
ncbi:hypothetical protein DC347_16315 [Pseudarthrobacter sp. AG30]|uniref:hypothetical protein n=1 Tax=Pseudarthrobacter sp. AG30 TaxID=2249742 RepID=UPI000D6E1D61|nr:hypothetical protein [Pseudarthrobacter sp. AG30]RAX15741.1 hypothetical protein DC347_16315 [Pseudarthrobacter sp. AG30]